jgi:Fe-S-cluster-containing dehydrogenase component
MNNVKNGMLIDLERCLGCWSCAMACKVGNRLADDEYRITVRTLGSGSGIDRPAGVFPNLSMGWMPVYNKTCVYCAPRVAEGNEPYCSYNCPTSALAFGDTDTSDSAYMRELARVRAAGYRVFELPAWEDKKTRVTYASRK